MMDAFRLIPALQVVFTHEIEFDDDGFADLTDQQYEAYVRREGKPAETLYRVLAFELHAIERTAEKITYELSVVTAAERQLLLDAVDFVYRASEPMPNKQPTFAERLAYLRPRLPPIVVQKLD